MDITIQYVKQMYVVSINKTHLHPPPPPSSSSSSFLSLRGCSGETGYWAMMESLAWAKRPMLQRVDQLPASLPVSMLYGDRSWMTSSSGHEAARIRGQAYTRVEVCVRVRVCLVSEDLNR